MDWAALMPILLAVLKTFANISGEISNGQLINSGKKEQLADDLQSERQANRLALSTRDAAFAHFDTSARAGRMPDDIKFAD